MLKHSGGISRGGTVIYGPLDEAYGIELGDQCGQMYFRMKWPRYNPEVTGYAERLNGKPFDGRVLADLWAYEWLSLLFFIPPHTPTQVGMIFILIGFWLLSNCILCLLYLRCRHRIKCTKRGYQKLDAVSGVAIATAVDQPAGNVGQQQEDGNQKIQ